MSARELVSELVLGPREAGTGEAVKARDKIQAFLQMRGYTVRVQRFRFSTAGLQAFPVFGAGLGWLGLLLTPLLALHQVAPWAALAVCLAGLAALGMIALGLGLGWSSMGGDQREDANLVATRGNHPVTRWIVAHLDTKAQGHSMAGRLVAVWVSVLSALLLTALALARLGGPVPVWAVGAVTGLAVIAGFLAGRGKLRGKSPGARDNGSGLLAALVVAERVDDPSIGILITGAEEFGLVGARYFAQETGSLAGCDVINFDTIDDRGPWRIVVHGAAARSLADRIAAALGPEVRQHRLPLGIFVDSLPLARAGARAVTVARLDWETLRVLHTPRDSPDGFALEPASRAGELVARLYQERL